MNKIISGVLIGLFLAAPVCSAVDSQQDSGPVKKLKNLYNTDKDFRENMDQAFQNLQPKPDGTANPWQGKSVDDLYSYFNDWFYFLPGTKDGLEYIEGFRWFYYKNPYGLNVVRKEPGLSWTKDFVVERGKFMDSKASAQGVEKWLQEPSVHMEDFVVPQGGFQSFNDFFTRNIKPGARPIAAMNDDTVVVAPSDCLLNIINSDLTTDSKIPLKGRTQLNINELLDHSQLSDHFVGGTAVSCILLPTTYHHYHAPVSGEVQESKENVSRQYFGVEDMPTLFSKGSAGYYADFSVFEHFIHGYFVIKTQDFGYVAMVPVGLNTVGSVVFEKKYKDIGSKTLVPVKKGEKLGHFAYGGSMIILLFEKDRFPSLKVPKGQQIGTFQ